MRRTSLLALLLGGCGEPTPTFTEIRDDTLLRSCGSGSCHGAGTSGLTMDPDAPDEVYGNLVDATADSGNVLVVPGDAAASYLFQKVSGAKGIEGDPMPPPVGLEEIDADALSRIEAWIEAGALDD